MLVNFLICGTQKGGTSALDAYCREHREIGMPAEKEQHFFDNDALFSTGRPDYSAYHGAFPADENFKVLGESTPVYMYWPQVPARIFDYNPGMKIIIILRNPIERAYSHWQMEKDRGHETMSFGEAVRSEQERLSSASPELKRVYSYLDRGFYVGQLERLWSLFGRSGVLVLRSEELMQNPGRVLEAVSGFLAVSPFTGMDNKRINVQSYEFPLSNEDRKYLAAVYEEEISRLERVLDWDCSTWRYP